MLFNSIHFLVFAPLVIVAYYLLPHAARRWLLLVSSLYFYAVFRVPFTLLLLLSVGFSYVAALAMEGTERPRTRRAWVLFAVLGNLSILFFFKYIDFAIRACNQALGLAEIESLRLESWGVILPMGISFFTLQSIGYAVDVYRRQIPATRSFFDLTLFISFFPQLVAGPIMRAKELIYQFADRHAFRRENIELGLYLVALGLLKKTLIADELSIAADVVYANPGAYSGVGNFAAALLFSIQIYCDFSGYSDVAVGLAQMFGFHFPMNFDRPFMSGTVTELWRRWHISLSGFLRDYVYITLGGNRVSLPRQYINIILTMFIGGLWHGADWTYIIWGLINAFAMVGERFVLGFDLPRRAWDRVPGALRAFYPYCVFAITMIFFRSYPTAGMESGVEVAFFMLGRIFTLADGAFPAVPASPFVLAIVLFLCEYLVERRPELLGWIAQRRVVLLPLAATVMVLCFFVYSVTTSPQFIYFQF